MPLPFRVRRPAPAPPEPGALPPASVERVLVALAVHAQQMSDRIDRIEQRMERRIEQQIELQVALQLAQQGDLSPAAAVAVDVPTRDDVKELREHSARLAAEMGQIAMELQVRLDDLADQMPGVVAESRRQERARTLAATIIDLSDSLDTGSIDLRNQHDDWASTA